MEKKELEIQIATQKEEDLRLYSIFQYKLNEEEMQPLIKKWREGSRHLKELISQLNQIKDKERELNPHRAMNTKTFVNSYGEATKREITSATYERANERLSKEIILFIS